MTDAKKLTALSFNLDATSTTEPRRHHKFSLAHPQLFICYGLWRASEPYGMSLFSFNCATVKASGVQAGFSFTKKENSK